MFRFAAGVRRPLAAASCAAVWCAGGLAAQTPARPYSAGLGDVLSVATAATVLLLGDVVEPAAARCAPCDRDRVPGFDRIAIDLHSGFARGGSDVLLIGVAGGSLLAARSGVSAERARGNIAVLANAIVWTAATTKWLKLGVHRERPELYRDNAAAAARNPNTRESFPSGHASVAFAVAAAYATLAHRQDMPHAGRNSVLLFGGAATVGALRVVGGRHFPTDVLGGAALGTLVGWVIATVHPKAP
ncbi:MAG: phosphatase PAP2 family protein [Gemmatimonadales bacterium]